MLSVRLRVRRRLVGSVATGCALAAGACEVFTGPQSVRTYVSRLEFAVSAPMLRDSGAVVVAAYPRDPDFELSRDERVRLIVTSSSGDRESLMLWHEGGARGTYHEGFFSTLGMFYTAEDGVDLFALEAKFRARGLSYWRPGDFTRSYQVIAFDPMHIAQLANELARWPETRFISFAIGPAFTDGGNALAAPLLLTFARPRRSDGVLQAAPGDTLRAIHVSPAGDTTQATIVIPTTTP